jgi:hypothetical protein
LLLWGHMRHVIWLAGCLLVFSCTVNNDNLNTDAGGTGGTTATGGVSGSGGAGGCPRCVGTGGATAAGGQPGTGGSATGGQGEGGVGGTGIGGKGTGGTGGQGGGQSCDALESDYGSALTAAKKCTPSATNQCQQLVNNSLSCPDCKQYVNDTSTLTAIQTEWDNQNCGSSPHACPAIACVVPTASVCTGAGTTTGGPNAGADPSGTCTSAQVTTAK